MFLAKNCILHCKSSVFIVFPNGFLSWFCHFVTYFFRPPKQIPTVSNIPPKMATRALLTPGKKPLMNLGSFVEFTSFWNLTALSGELSTKLIKCTDSRFWACPLNRVKRKVCLKRFLSLLWLLLDTFLLLLSQVGKTHLSNYRYSKARKKFVNFGARNEFIDFSIFLREKSV